MLENLMGNPIAWAVLSICTILSLGLAVYFGIKGKTSKKLSSYRASCTVVRAGNSFMPNLQLFYKKQEISELSVTQYIIWNSGNYLLKAEDVVDDKPLRIVSNKPMKTKILDAKIYQCIEETNNFIVSELKDEELKISFEYVDPKDGIAIQIIHTGSVSDLCLEYKLKGWKEYKEKHEKNFIKIKGKNKRRLLAIDFLLLLITCAITLSKSILLVISTKEVFEILIILAFSGMMLICVIYMTYIATVRIFHLNIPQKLRSSIDSINLAE